MKFTLDIPRNMTKTKQRLAQDLNKWMAALEVMVDRLTPEDSWAMLEHNKREPASIEWNIITSRVYNDVESKRWFPYAKAVESWVQWTAYSYQKPKWNRWRYIWVGVHTYERALAAMKPIILQFLKR